MDPSVAKMSRRRGGNFSWLLFGLCPNHYSLDQDEKLLSRCGPSSCVQAGHERGQILVGCCFVDHIIQGRKDDDDDGGGDCVKHIIKGLVQSLLIKSVPHIQIS